MASPLTLCTPSTRSLRLTQVSIVLLVVIIGIASALILRSTLERYKHQPDSIPIANGDTWEALGR